MQIVVRKPSRKHIMVMVVTLALLGIMLDATWAGGCKANVSLAVASV